MISLANRRRAMLFAGALGAVWFVAVGCGPWLDPTHDAWLFESDLAQHYLGWQFFRHAEWSFPVSAMDNFVHPLGTTIGFTDSNPLLAIPAKLLGPWLPERFQYIGPWLLACVVLQGVWGARIASRFLSSYVAAGLAGGLFAVAPVLVFRFGHDTLCAHWLILAAIDLHLGAPDDIAGRRRSMAWGLLLVAVGSGVHPYLAAMTATLVLALAIRFLAIDRVWRYSEGLGGAAAVLLVPTAIFWGLGYFTAYGRETDVGGFGHFSADLLSFVNPCERSRFLPPLPTGPGQYEGFGYLGLGAILLLAFVAVRRYVSPRPRPPWVPERQGWLIVACMAMAVYSLSSRVTLLGETLFTVGSLPEPFDRLTAPFRSSGRFLWPLYYLTLIGSIALLSRGGRPGSRVPGAVLGVALLLQVADQSVFLGERDAPVARSLESRVWGLLDGSYEHLSAVPPAITAAAPCAGFGPEAIPLADLAWRHGLTFDGGYVARADWRQVRQQCRAILARAESGDLERRTVYLVDPARFPDGLPGGLCGSIEGRQVCVRAGNRDPLARRLAGEAPPAPVH